MGESFLMIGKGPYYWGANFVVGWWVFKSHPFSQTCSPSLNWMGMRHSFDMQRAASALSHASQICHRHMVMLGTWASSSDRRNRGFTLKRSLCDARVVWSWGQGLWTNSASDKYCAHIVWSSAVQMRRYCLSHWLAHSLAPLVCGWKAINIFCWICRSWQSSVVKWKMNCGLRLLMILQGMLNHGTKCCRYNAATPSLVMFMVQGINFMALKQLCLMIISMVLKLFDSGKSMIRSIATIWKGPEWGSGVISCSRAFQCVVHDLFSWQVAHLWMYSSANSFIPLLLYVWARRWVMLAMPGCPASGWSWYNFKISCHALSSSRNWTWVKCVSDSRTISLLLSFPWSTLKGWDRKSAGTWHLPEMC